MRHLREKGLLLFRPLPFVVRGLAASRRCCGRALERGGLGRRERNRTGGQSTERRVARGC